MHSWLCFPADSKGQQCGEASAETQHLVSGERRQDSTIYIKIIYIASYLQGSSSFDTLFSLFLYPPEAVYKSSCCLTVHAISQYSPDVLKAHASVALPLAFLGMHQQPDEQGDSADANLWAEVWQDHVPGKE